MKKRGRVRNRPTIINDEPRDAKPLNWSKSSVSVGHEDLRMGNRNLDSSTLHRRSSSIQGSHINQRPWAVQLDMAYPGYRVAVEYDGRQHAEGAQFEIDADRWYAIEREGWIVVRALAHHLRSPGLVADRVREALTSRGWAPRAKR